MAVNPMLSAAGNSMLQATRALDSAAAELVHQQVNVDGEAPSHSDSFVQDTAEAMLDLQLYKRQVQASAQVVKTADEVLGFLLDVHA
ncbi:MAG: flagellar biosynthesis protein FlgE [Pseudomonadota bacterium]